MPHEFDSGRPIYTQLLELITASIAAGELTPGQRLPGVREMAVQYGVNPNTVQRTMSELERQGLVYAERTAGRFVTTDQGRIVDTKQAIARSRTAAFLKSMESLGYTRSQVLELLEKEQYIAVSRE